jgi:hypothetical protein
LWSPRRTERGNEAAIYGIDVEGDVDGVRLLSRHFQRNLLFQPDLFDVGDRQHVGVPVHCAIALGLGISVGRGSATSRFDVTPYFLRRKSASSADLGLA